MVRVLNVAEKPSVAKELARIFGEGRASKRRGRSQYNPVFTYNYRGETHVMTSVTGHLMELVFPRNYSDWKNTDPSSLFDCAIVKQVDPKKEPLASGLREQARTCQKLILWLDCDREGENISFEVVSECRKANPRIQILRARFASLLPQQVHSAINNLVQPNQRESDAVDARIEIDLRCGSAFTRYLTLRYQNQIGTEAVQSYGPCQFPALGFIVHRFNAIQEFVSEPFWRLSLELTKDEKNVNFKWSRNRLFERGLAVALYERAILGRIATITNVDRHPKRRYRPFPLTTVSLQKLAASKLRMGSQQLMQIAEHLYTSGFISYPRTETNSFPQGFPFQQHIRTLQSSPQYGDYAEALLSQGKFLTPKRGRNNDNAHTPIHPVKFPANLRAEQRKVYDLVARHYLACCSQDALGAETIVTLELGGEYFTAQGLIISEKNYLEVYLYDRWSDKELPQFQQGERLEPSSLEVLQGTTSPPSMLTEKDLISLMDKHEIGTDATIHEHIEKIIQRFYVEKQGQYFYPTQLGAALVNGYDRMGFDLSSPTLRAQTERNMLAVARGELTKEQMLTTAKESYKQVFLKQQEHIHILDEEITNYFGAGPPPVVHPDYCICPLCQNGMQLEERNASFTLVCNTCNERYPLPGSSIVGQSPAQPQCPICNFPVLINESKNGFQYPACVRCHRDKPHPFFTSSRTDCRGCTNVECSLAGGFRDRPVRNCLYCQGKILVKKNSSGGFFLSCSEYKTCSAPTMNLLACKSAAVSLEKCQSCSQRARSDVFKIDFTFTSATRPFWCFGLSEKFCIAGCNPDMNDALRGCNRFDITDILIRRRQQQHQQPRQQQHQQPRQQHQRRPPPSNVQQHHWQPRPRQGHNDAPQHNNRPQQGVCFKCNQPGHWAQQCPNDPQNANNARARGGGGGGGGRSRNFGGSGARQKNRSTTNNKRKTPTSRKCGKCGAVGHTARSKQCPKYVPRSKK